MDHMVRRMLTAGALAAAVMGISAAPSGATVGQAGLRAVPSSDLVVAAKRQKPSRTQRQQQMQKRIQQQIEQYMGKQNYQQMMGGEAGQGSSGQGIPWQGSFPGR